MNSTLFTKDIKLLLKDLKFQIFFLILVALFILSSISSAVAYADQTKGFQDGINAHRERVTDGSTTQLSYMLYIDPLRVISPPSPAVLFSSYGKYPDRINNGVMFYDPAFSKYDTTKSKVFHLNWHFIIGILSGFIMLIMSFEAISYEKRAGTLRLLSIYGFKRQTILWYKYLSYMLLYLLIVIPPALISLVLFFALTGTWSFVFMLKFMLIMLLSIPFASFFVLLGVLISMAKNYRNAIVMVVFVWLLFVIIIPQSATIIGKQLAPVKTNIEYEQMKEKAYDDEWKHWEEEYSDTINSNAGYLLKDGLRARAWYAADEKKNQVVQRKLSDSEQQTRTIANIASISPFTQFEKIPEIVFDKGLYMFEILQQTTKRTISELRNLIIEQDSRDPSSLHQFYSHAAGDNTLVDEGIETFSSELFDHPDLLFVTDIVTDDGLVKTLKILLHLLPILLLNIILVVWCVMKLERLDIR